MNPLRIFALTLGLAALSGPAAAASDLQLPSGSVLIFSNLGPKGQLYSDTQGWAEEGTETKYGTAMTAFAFRVSGSSFVLTQIDFPIWLYRNAGKGHTFTFAVAADAGNSPGAHIFEQQLTLPFQPRSCCKLVKVTVSGGAVKLVKGKRYWVEAVPSPTTAGGWPCTYHGKHGDQSTSFDGGRTWSGGESEIGGAFAVYGTPAG